MSLELTNTNGIGNTAEEDYKIIVRILEGETSNFEILQKKYKRVISSLIRRMVKDEDDIDDLTQETFIKAYNALNKFQPGYAFSSWIYRIASNTCIDFMRKKRFNFVYIDQPIKNDEDEQYIEIEDTSYQPDTEYLINERKNILKNAIDALPENYRTIIRMRHEEDLDYKEISTLLDLPLGTVKAHLFRARKLLLNALQGHQHLLNEI
jgi:RNA polymerase sigma-70 factor (ECF subfamily)